METSTTEIIQKLQNLKSALTAKNVVRVRLFGSTVTGLAQKDSDVDILLNFSTPPSLFDLSEIQVDLTDSIGREVDLALADRLRPAFRDRILNEAVDVWGE